MSKLSSLLLAPLLSGSLVLLAQTSDTATLHDRVVDRTNTDVPDVAITIVNSLTSLRKVAKTDAYGNFYS
jgi:hypothetical protein